MVLYDEGTIPVQADASATTAVDALTYALETLAVEAAGSLTASTETPGEVRYALAKMSAALVVQKGAVTEATSAVQADASCALAVEALGDPDNIAYNVYRGVDGAAIDFASAPWATGATLPITGALATGHTYRLVTRYVNRYGYETQNLNEQTITVAGDASETPQPPTGPLHTIASAAINAQVAVLASYAKNVDGSNAATHWLRYDTDSSTPIDPDVATPTVTAMVFAGGVAHYAFTGTSYGAGATVQVLLRTRRVTAAGSYDSENLDIHAVTTSETGPS